MCSHYGNQMNEIFGVVLAAFVLLTVLVIAIVMVVVLWRICRKAGFSGWLSLLILVPAVGPLILVVLMAFMDWPVLRELRALKQAQATGGQEPRA